MGLILQTWYTNVARQLVVFRVVSFWVLFDSVSQNFTHVKFTPISNSIARLFKAVFNKPPKLHQQKSLVCNEAHVT